MTEIEVRAPWVGEAETLAAVHVTGWRQTYGRLLPESFFDDAFLAARRGMWERMLDAPRPGHRIAVAERGGEVIGFAWSGPAIAEPDEVPPRQSQLYAIYVLVDHHGTGAGQALLDDVLGDAPATLWVERGNARAAAFYARNGFRPDGTEKIDAGTPSIVEVRMLR
jgi:GNAT superfamily N-acetyltransferase